VAYKAGVILLDGMIVGGITGGATPGTQPTEQ
jgi:hypothetical protein